uniref:Cytochrome P450 2K1-like n=1 Tax=Oryzias melastigma TaxID=30732 RepID=A0A3B3BUB6_ORYME
MMESLASLVSIPTTVIGVVFLLLVFYLSSASKDLWKDPPGPRPLPLLGNLLQLDPRRPYKALCELSKSYGPVFTVYFGIQKVVVLAGYKAVKEALINNAEEFGDRDISPIFQDMNKGHGILFANGESWKEMRRFALSTLRDFGMGKRIAEEKILEECDYLIQGLEKQEGNPVDMAKPLNYATSNIISSIVYGSRFDYDDPRFRNMVRRANETIRFTGYPLIHLYNMFPRFFKWTKYRKIILKNVEMTIRDVKDLVKHLKETLNPSVCRGFVDCYLIKKKKEEDSCVKETHFNEQNLFISVSNLFAAGTDTTATTLRWALLLMAKYPHIQDKVHEELAKVVGGRQVRVDDRKNLPYSDAVIHEVQRLASIVPMSIPHKTNRDVTFHGYFIKKVKSFLHFKYNVKSLVTLTFRRRACLGESLAKMELFLFFTSLLQRFHFTPPPGVSEEELDLTPALGFVIPPAPHELCAVSLQ